MPITGPSSYMTTVPLFTNHWADVNAELGATPLTLDAATCGQPPGEIALTDLQTHFTALTVARSFVENALLEASLEQATADGHKRWLNAAIASFNRSMRADHGSSHFIGSLPAVTGTDVGREKFLAPVRLTEALWAKVNVWRASASGGGKPPLTLPSPVSGGEPIDTGEFATRAHAARTALNSVEERGQQATLERAERDALQAVIYPILKVYRLKVAAAFPPDHPLVASLPALTEDSEATPEPGTLSGAWDSQQNKAVLTGTPSPSASVVRHQIRATVGEAPELEDEVVRAEFALGEPITLTTDYGLVVPGEKAHFRLVAITADGHEKGTPWVTIQRPL